MYTDVDEIVWVYVGCDATITAVDFIPVRPPTSVLPTIDNRRVMIAGVTALPSMLRAAPFISSDQDFSPGSTQQGNGLECCNKKRSTSSPSGMDACAPGRVTEIAATAEANTALSSTV